jgi:hypothetical protein
MNKEFISYEQALELKQLGFDEPCLAFYPIYEIQDKRHPIKEGTLVMINQGTDYWGEMYYTDDIETTDLCHLYQCAAPLYQQAFRWLHEQLEIKGLMPTTDFEYQSQMLNNLIKMLSSKKKKNKANLPQLNLPNVPNIVSFGDEFRIISDLQPLSSQIGNLC